MIDYVRKGGYKTASGLVRKRYEHHVEQWGMSLDDFARGELGNTFAVLGNSTPCALWVLFHIFSDDRVLADVRNEVSAMVKVREEDGVNCLDLATIRTSCPILLSTFQETLRFRAVNSGPRVILEEVLLNDHTLLKKGSMLMIPAPVQHTDTSAWGDNVENFDHMRFVHRPGQKRPNRVAFRGKNPPPPSGTTTLFQAEISSLWWWSCIVPWATLCKYRDHGSRGIISTSIRRCTYVQRGQMG